MSISTQGHRTSRAATWLENACFGHDEPRPSQAPIDGHFRKAPSSYLAASSPWLLAHRSRPSREHVPLPAWTLADGGPAGRAPSSWPRPARMTNLRGSWVVSWPVASPADPAQDRAGDARCVAYASYSTVRRRKARLLKMHRCGSRAADGQCEQQASGGERGMVVVLLPVVLGEGGCHDNVR